MGEVLLKKWDLKKKKKRDSDFGVRMEVRVVGFEHISCRTIRLINYNTGCLVFTITMMALLSGSAGLI